MICKKCGIENPEESQFCSKCGNNLKINKRRINNIFSLLSLICFIISFFLNSNFMAVLMIISFVLSIIGIVKSHKLKKEIGKRKGLTISIIICILTVFLLLGLITSYILIYEENNMDFVGEKIEQIAMQKVQQEIKNQLKNPQSLQIHNIKKYYFYVNDNGKADTYYTQNDLKIALENNQKKEYRICYEIEYSAQNGFGGMNREVLNARIDLYNREEKITCSNPSIEFID